MTCNKIKFKKIAIIGTHYQSKVAEDVLTVCHFLQNFEVDLFLETETALAISSSTISNISVLSLCNLALKCDIAIVIGGDGNFLHAGRFLSLYSEIPIIGINRGRLGFLTDIYPENMAHDLLGVLLGDNYVEKRFMLECKIDGVEIPLEASVAFNDIRISAGERNNMFGVKVFIDRKYAFNQRGDGLLISTPTGSTAHAMSAGGPIMHTSLDCVEIVPVCSHSLSARPVVISADSEIDIVITKYNQPTPVLTLDGKYNLELKAGSKISLCKFPKKVHVLHKKGHNYYDTLRNKLGWSKVLF